MYHNRIMVLIGSTTLLFLSLSLRLAPEFDSRAVELFMMGFLTGSLVFVFSSYRMIKRLDRDGRIEQLTTKKDVLRVYGIIVSASVLFGWHVSRRGILPLEETYGGGAMWILITGFILPVWFWIFSIIRWEKRNRKLLVIKRIGLFGSIIEPIETGERMNSKV